MAVMKYFSCGALALFFFPLEQRTQKKVEKQNKTFLKKLKCQRKLNSCSHVPVFCFQDRLKTKIFFLFFVFQKQMKMILKRRRNVLQAIFGFISDIVAFIFDFLL